MHSKERLLQTQKEIQSYQVPCLAYMGDMGDMKCCEEWFEQVKKQFGGADILINNAGIAYIGLLQDMSTEAVSYTHLHCLYFVPEPQGQGSFG